MSKYKTKHHPKNQKKIQGVIFNPIQSIGFDSTDHDERDALEKAHWWGLAYIVTTSVDEMYGETWSQFQKRLNDVGIPLEITKEEFEKVRQKSIKNWFEHWADGIRYEVRRLDGGAWDRSTSLMMTGNKQNAIDFAKQCKCNGFQAYRTLEFL